MISFIKEKVTCWEKLAAETRPIFIYGMGDGALKIMAVFREKASPFQVYSPAMTSLEAIISRAIRYISCQR